MSAIDGWRTTPATVYTCGDWEQGTSWKLWGKGSSSGHLIVFSYKVNGETYSGEFMGTAMKPGDTFEIRYDPDDPNQNDTSMDSKRSKASMIAAAAGGLLIAGLLIWFEIRFEIR
jgi:hypothetical protein